MKIGRHILIIHQQPLVSYAGRPTFGSRTPPHQDCRTAGFPARVCGVWCVGERKWSVEWGRKNRVMRRSGKCWEKKKKKNRTKDTSQNLKLKKRYSLFYYPAPKKNNDNECCCAALVDC